MIIKETKHGHGQKSEKAGESRCEESCEKEAREEEVVAELSSHSATSSW
jgi:hypothetical protein